IEEIENAGPLIEELPLLTLIETSKVDDPLFTVPATTEHDATQKMPQRDAAFMAAIAMIRAAGYRVSKRKIPKNRKPKDRVGPTFVAEFADGTTTRMSVFTSPAKLDWDRGERLSITAYQTRGRTRERQQGRAYSPPSVAPVPPAIVSARFEQDGKVLGTRP